MPMSITAQMYFPKIKIQVIVQKFKKKLPAKVRDLCSIPGLGRFPGEGYGNPLQYSRLQNPMDKGAWWATVLLNVGSQRVGHDQRDLAAAAVSEN